MSLWQHPRWITGLCTIAVLACAAMPALFLTAVDTARLGRSEAVTDAYTAPVPSADDYYILRQLTARQQQQTNSTLPMTDDEEPRSPLKMYVEAQNGLESMMNGYAYAQTVEDTLHNLADQGILAPEWVDWATDWDEGELYFGYNSVYYDLGVPYYTTDSLGFVTIKRFAMEQEALYTVFSLTMDSRTGVVTQLWISAPRTGDEAPAAPDEAGLRAFAAQAGLETLGDWAVPENTPYTHALYSAHGEALITAAVSPYEYTGWSGSTTVTSERWFLSLGLQPCAEGELPFLVS